MNTQDITVDLSKKNVKPESIVLRQGDKSGTTLRVKVLDNGVNVSSLDGYVAKFIMKLPYNRFYYEVEGTISGSMLTFVIDESYAAVQSGVTNIAYVALVNGETTRMSANNIRVEILPSALDGFTPPPEWTDPIDEFIEEQTARVDTIVENAESATTAANTAATNANDKAALANTAATNANNKAGLADEAATNANAKAQEADEAAQAADEAREAIQDDLGAKANKDGHYSLLGAGTSDALMSTDGGVDTFARRVSEHDGACRITSLRGNTVRWNQLSKALESGNWVKAYSASTKYTVTAGEGIATLTVTEDYTSTNNYAFGIMSATFDGDETIQHKYLSLCEFKVSATLDHIYLWNGGSGSGNNKYTAIDISGMAANAWHRVGAIMAQTTETAHKIKQQVCIGNETFASGFEFQMRNAMLFDLTAMFGAGNEPATVEEFERQYPESYYPYDAGSLLSVNIEGIEGAGIVLEIPPSTLFTDGILRSAGSAYDERTPTRDVKRIGVVDLGALNWSKTTPTDYDAYFTSSVVTGAKPTSGYWTSAPNIICVGYQTVSTGNVKQSTVSSDKIITINNGSNANVLVKDTAFTDADTFKSAMNGVMLYYELATPTEAAIDPPLNLAYPTEQGGTESIVIPTGEQSAPPTMAAVYAYSADGVRDISQAIIANIEGNIASTNYAIGGYFVHDGKLCRVTSPIASGETISPGVNCAVTTVMQEVIALFQSI